MTKLGLSLNYDIDISTHTINNISKSYEYAFFKAPRTIDLVKLIELTILCHERFIKTIVDINYHQLIAISANPVTSNQFLKCKIDYLRLDEDFDANRDEELINKYARGGIALNASRISIDSVQQWAKYHVPLIAVHNYYPGNETGLSPQYVSSRNYVLNNMNIETFVFVNKQDGICSTFEETKQMSYSEMFQYIESNVYCSGCLIGDSHIDDSSLNLFANSLQNTELLSLSNNFPVKDPTGEKIVMVKLITHNKFVKEKLLNGVHTMRNDHPSFCLRSSSSRMINGFGEKIEEENNYDREAGCITIENKLAGKYSGEIRVVTTPLSAAVTSNVIGLILGDINNLERYERLKFEERK